MDRDKQEDLVIKGVALIGGYFLVVKPLLKYIGINPADQQAVQAHDALNPNDDAFNMNSQWSSNISASDWQSVKAKIDAGIYMDSSITNEEALAAGVGDDLESQFGYNSFNFAPDFTTVLSQFSKLQSKQQISDIDAYLQANYNQGLWALLKNGFPIPPLAWIFPSINTGFSDSQLAQILNVVNNLPDTVGQ